MAEKPYRVEAAPSARSACTISKAKIEKGELRLGSFVSFGGKGSYKWRRLSCITSKQAANIEKELGGPGFVDGFAELSAERQAVFEAAFKTALEGGGPAAAEAPKDGAEDDGMPPAKKAKVDAAPKPKPKAKGKAKAKAKAASSEGLEGAPAIGISAPAALAPDAIGLAHSAIDIAKAGTWDGLYKVLDTQPGLVNVRPDVREYSVLHQAAYHGNLDAVQTLIDKYGADPSLRTKFGKSAIDIAQEHGHVPVADFVALRLAAAPSKGKAELGVELTPEKVQKEDKFACWPGKSSSETTKTVNPAVAQPALTSTVIHTAHRAIDLAKTGQWEDLFTLLDFRKDIVNIRPDVRDYGVLHQAAFHGDRDAVNALLKTYGADPARRTKSGKTAAEVAREHGNSKVADVIEEHLALAPEPGAMPPHEGPPDQEEDDDDFKMVQMPDGTWKVCTAADKPAAPAPSASVGACTANAAQEVAPTGTASSSSSSGSASRPTTTGSVAVDSHFPEAAACRVHSDDAAWSCALTRRGFGGTSGQCVLQLLEARAGGGYCVWARWGASDSQRRSLRTSSLEEAKAAFESQFLEKTGNRWQDRDNFKPMFGKYILSKTEGVSAAGSAPAAASSVTAAAPLPAASSAAVATTPVPAMSADIMGAAHKAIDLAKAARWADLYGLLDKQPELVNVRPEVREFSALHQAAYHGNREVVATLINKYGADPAQKTKLGVSAAVVALGQGHSQVADFISARLPA